MRSSTECFERSRGHSPSALRTAAADDDMTMKAGGPAAVPKTLAVDKEHR
jgi:hypothetical protein